MRKLVELKRNTTHRTEKSKLAVIRTRLLRWYDQNRRDLLWRRTADPYAIWISETMLQQTQVNTVLPFYRRFLKAFPTVADLDRAATDKVLSLWSGLGYYRRARNLKKAARKIMKEYRGKMPRDFHALRSLPGIGPYTAGAVMSIAFNQPYPALDGNARRVLARLFPIERPRDLEGVAASLLSKSRPGDFNQALMELGSTKCLSRNPQCPSCPLARFCRAKKSGCFKQKFPAPKKSPKKNIQWPLVAIAKNGKILLKRRPPGSLLEGLWELPGGERKKGEPLRSALARYLNGLAIQAKSYNLIGEVRHGITYRAIKAPVFGYAHDGTIPLPGPEWRWFSVSSLHRYPLSSLSLKAVRLVSRETVAD